MIRKLSLLLLFFILAAGFSNAQKAGLTSWVDPFIGTGGHGHTYPGAMVPFGMVQLSPDTRLKGWDGCSAYHYSDSVIYGFSHTHLSGTGCSDYGDVLLMPVVNKVKLNDYEYKAPFSHQNESAEPGYYSVMLDGISVKAEMTVTARAGMHRYTFPQGAQQGMVIDLKHRDKVLDSYLDFIDDSTVAGFRKSDAWADSQFVYFAIRFSKPIRDFAVSVNGKMKKGKKYSSGTDVKALIFFDAATSDQLIVKVGISAVSVEGARKNLDSEIKDWNFEDVRKQADDAWEKELNKVFIKYHGNIFMTDSSGNASLHSFDRKRDQEKRKIFYTALYHNMLAPNLCMDVDSLYRGRDLKIHKAKGFENYTVFSLWDTYRAEHPLLTIIDQKRTNDFINTFIAQYQQGGALPVWELAANETGCMIGYHAVPVIADAYLKGIRGYDADKAFEAMKHSAGLDHLGLESYRKYGFIPSADNGESVSKTLEYAYDDWCIAQMAKAMGREDDHDMFIERAQYYKNLFDPQSGFMRARVNGGWFTPFDPAEVNFNYTEANAWQYSFYAPQDVDGLITLLGGKEQFAEKLDALFTAETKTTGREQPDITGLIGQYAHGNEPSHHIAYLYNYAGQPWKTQEYVHRIMKEMHSAKPDGLIGNEDCGQMSAWLVFSALGFYPVTPASDIYIIGTPMFAGTVIALENGNKFTVSAKNLSDSAFCIQSATLNGEPLTRSYITHGEIMAGGELAFVMGAEPNKSWGSGDADIPRSAINKNRITPVPLVAAGRNTFNDTTAVMLSNAYSHAVIRYTTDGSEPDVNSQKYTLPLKLDNTTALKAKAFAEGCAPSITMEAKFIKIPGGRSIKLKNEYASQYSAGGNEALIDYQKGTDDFRTGMWQGYHGVDLDATVDIGGVKSVSSFSIRFLQDMGSWIFMPLKVEFYSSADGKSYTRLGAVKTKTSQKAGGGIIEEFRLKTKITEARYIRIVGHSQGVCPAWHDGAGKKCWLFADEITVE